MTGVHRDTIMRLGVRIGQGCTALLDAKMRNLNCNNRLKIPPAVSPETAVRVAIMQGLRDVETA